MTFAQSGSQSDTEKLVDMLVQNDKLMQVAERYQNFWLPKMFEEIIQKCILQVRECSFFGSLMLFAEIETSKSLSTAATDGKKIFFNEKF